MTECHCTLKVVHAGLALSLLAAVTTTLPARADESSSTADRISVAHAIDEFYRPAHQSLAEQSSRLAYSVDGLCEALASDPSSPSSVGTDTQQDTSGSLAEVRENFTHTTQAFSRIEYLRVGPLLESNRLNRLYYWPDSRRVTERQLRRELASIADVDPSRAPEDISGKSVAVQGLPALERLLYTSVLTDLSRDLNGCALARNIAHNVANVSEALAAAWQAQDGISADLLSPDAESNLFRSHREVTRSVLTQVSAGLELIALRKLEPLQHSEARWRDAPFGRSQLTLQNLSGNLSSLQDLLESSGMDQFGNVKSQLDFEFRIAQGHLDSLAELDRLSDDAGLITPEAAKLFMALQSTVSSLGFTVNDRLSEALGVSAGFNSADGD